MPPKKKQQESTKNKATKQTQKAADKTFGLKNKNKSAKVQRFVQQVEAQTKNAALDKRKIAEAERKAAEKKAAEAARAEVAALFKPAQKVPFGVDPKSVVCIYFKQGACTKGKNCKFSHDLTKERKAAKKDLYADDREAKEKDTMDDWDEEKLRSVVMSKHGNPQTTTDIVCKHFIEAVENGKYGWFWACPNGGDKCKYRHSLPPGFVLKTKEQRRLEREAAANEPQITLEELVETERAKLPKNLTPVSIDTFTEWKRKRDEKLRLLKEKEGQAKKKDSSKQLSGREIFLSGKYKDEDEEDESDSWDFTALRRRVEDEQDETPADESNE
ncbi:hypothetical protein TRVA0_066S00320 [Trichomonascus vanleenenianus]|uniref:translation machinery-associated protein TMA46 n=1 Tax=Trichomonascus vanleenenianus TaxID=2268995 RepID=UPI003EC9CC59